MIRGLLIAWMWVVLWPVMAAAAQGDGLDRIQATDEGLSISDAPELPYTLPAPDLSERQNKEWVRVGPCGATVAPLESLIDNPRSYYADPEERLQIYPGFTKRIVTCVQATMIQIADSYLGPIADTFKTFVTGLITIYIIVFGIKVALGAIRATKSDFFMVVITIALVSYATLHNGLNTYYQIFLNSQGALVSVVTGTINDAHNVVGADGKVEQGVCGDYRDVWQKFDCTIALYMGYDPARAAGQPGGMAVAPYAAYDGLTKEKWEEVRENGILSLAPFAIITAGLFSQYGLILFLLGLGFAVLLVLAIVQAVVVYVGSLVVLTFLSIVGYITIPMALFPQTKQVFSSWLQLVFAYTIQPAIMMAYLVFMVHVLDIAFNHDNGRLDIGNTPMSLLYQQLYSKDDVSCRKQFKEFISTTQDVVAGEESVSEECQTTEGNVASGTRSAFQLKDIVLLSKGRENLNCDAINDLLQPTQGGGCEGGTSVQESVLEIYNDAKQEGMLDFLMNMITVTLLLLITYSFMANVLAFGATLAGVTATPVSKAMNFYNMALARINSGK